VRSRKYGVGKDGAAAASGEGGGRPAPEPALVVEPLSDGSYAVRLATSGIRIQQESDTRYRIVAGDGRGQDRKGTAEVMNDALRLLAENTQQHAFEAIKTIQTVIKAVVRGVFNIGIVLMISAYLLVTSDRGL
jgi:hypothetical protein